MIRRRAVLALAVVALTVASGGAAAPATTTAAAATSRATTSAATASCPARRRAPDPQRPQVWLDLRLSDHHTRVTGTERIVFRPDLPTDRLVFRLTANSTYLVRQGTSVRVTGVTATPGGAAFGFARAGAAAATQGGLLIVPLAGTVPAGTEVRATIRFAVTLGARTGDRIGRRAGYAWFGSGQPLLAWQRGYGWHTEPMIPFPAETATSEAMDTHLSVSAPAADTVIATGRPTGPQRLLDRRIWRTHEPAARDVSIAAGPFRLVDRTVGATALRVGAATAAAARSLAGSFARALTELAGRLGRYPFATLSVARLPGSGDGGIEYPSAIQLFDSDTATVVHESAHQWFYGLVGDSQSLHPWLDEAFAEYAERLVDGRPEPRRDLDAPGTVGRSVQSYGTDVDGYYFVTYAKGAAALEAARAAAGGRAWDAALRCYVRAEAWRIAVPADLRRAIAAFPRAIAVLRRAGALP